MDQVALNSQCALSPLRDGVPSGGVAGQDLITGSVPPGREDRASFNSMEVRRVHPGGVGVETLSFLSLAARRGRRAPGAGMPTLASACTGEGRRQVPAQRAFPWPLCSTSDVPGPRSRHAAQQARAPFPAGGAAGGGGGGAWTARPAPRGAPGPCARPTRHPPCPAAAPPTCQTQPCGQPLRRIASPRNLRAARPSYVRTASSPVGAALYQVTPRTVSRHCSAGSVSPMGLNCRAAQGAATLCVRTRAVPRC